MLKIKEYRYFLAEDGKSINREKIELKELEKFGYKLGNWGLMGKCYLKELKYMDAVYITEDRNIIFDFEDVIDMEKCIESALYDINQAGLVEKVKED